MKRQWARAVARENRMIARNNRVLFTSYLMESGYSDPYYIATFWGISSNTAKTYMKEAAYVRLVDEDRDKIKAIQEKENCDLPTAIAKYYEKLTSKVCFIATAAYGTPFAHEIDTLRLWRDNFLEIHLPGRLFIRFYYEVSPRIANFISEKKLLRKFIRIVLNPCIFILKKKYT